MRSHFCIVCGSKLQQRAAAAIEVDLTHVRWLLAEVERWDASLSPSGVKRVVKEHYVAHFKLLTEAFEHARQAEGPPLDPVPLASAPSAATLPVPPTPDPETLGPLPVAPEAAGPADAPVDPAPPVQPEPVAPPPEAAPAPRPPPRVLHRPPPPPPAPPRPSAWERLWRPLIGESLGWFIGAFLILAGTFAYVSGEWGSMSEVSRALTVFGVMVFWALGFAGWARLLSRKEATRPASTVLWRIAAAVAPLATVALGPILSAAPLLAWPLMLGQAGLAAALARKVGWDAWADAAPERRALETLVLAVAMGLATLILGAAPMLATPSAAWLELAPVALAFVAWREGPEGTGKRTTFALATMAYATFLLAVRLHVALESAGEAAPWGLHAVMLSAFATAALELRPPTPKAADAFRVLVVAVQGLVLAPAFFAPAPAFLMAVLLATVTTARLANRRGPAEVAAARWLVPAYAFGFVAFQRLYELVPGPVMQWYRQLKEALGYSTQPLPPSYLSVTGALFVLAVGGWAGLRLARAQTDGQRARSSMLLSCTAWGAALFGAVALASLTTDTRPALISVPLLLVLTLALAFWHERADLMRSAAFLAVASGAVFAEAADEAWPAGVLALGLAALSVLAPRAQRLPLALAVGLLGLLTFTGSFLGAPHLSQAVALVTACAALVLVARNLDDPALLSLACTTPLLVVLRFGLPWQLSLVGLALVAALPSPAKRGSRLGALWTASFAAAFAAPIWQVVHDQDWPSLTFALGAPALILGARRTRAVDPTARALTIAAELLGLLFVLAALAPLSDALAPYYKPWHAQLAAGALALGASVVAVWKQRSWQGAVLAGGAVLLGFGCVGWSSPEVPQLRLAMAGLVALLATGALLPSVTVPLAAAGFVLAGFESPYALVAVAAGLTVVALFEEWDVTWRFALNRAVVSWAGALSAAAVLGLAVAAHTDDVLLAVAMALLPLGWARATRHGVFFSLGVALSAELILRDWWYRSPPHWVWLLGPLSAIGFGRVALGVPRVRALLGVGARWQTLLVSVCLGAGLMAAGTPSHGASEPWLGAAWVTAVLLVGSELLTVNLAGAALLLCFMPELRLGGAAVLGVLAVALHHAPGLTSLVLGAAPSKHGPRDASLGAVLVALVACVLFGGEAAQVTLAAALVVAAVLLGQWYLVSAAVLLAGVDLHRSLDVPAVVLLPWAAWVAVGAAALAVALRPAAVEARVRALWALVGRAPSSSSVAAAWWWGALALVVSSWATWSSLGPAWLAAAALLLLTFERVEFAAGVLVAAVTTALALPHEVAGLTLAVAGSALGWLGAVRAGKEPVALLWLHAGWLLALAGLVVVGPEVGHPAVAASWALGAVTAWSLFRFDARLEGIGWAASWLASHVLVAHLGVRFSTGAPPETIAPYLALASALVALPALLLSGEGGSQRRGAGVVLGSVAAFELLAAFSLIHGVHPREALVGLAAGGLVLAGAGRRAVRFDDALAAWLGQGVVLVSALVMRRLGAGGAPGVFESWAALTLGPVLWGLSTFLAREERTEVARALRTGAALWPLVGLLAAPWSEPGQLVLLLLVMAGHFTWLARAGLRRTGAGLAALAFNGAMVAAFFASGWHSVQDLALPLGLSVLALTQAFAQELGRSTQVKLRALAMAAIYAAAAWRPLTFTSTWGLVVCVLVCVGGVAAGAALRIRSFVLLGSAFLVTSVVATLVRQGLAEPRLGAVLLAAVGVGIVAFMVVFTTRRAELQQRVSRLQTMFSDWEG